MNCHAKLQAVNKIHALSDFDRTEREKSATHHADRRNVSPNTFQSQGKDP